MPDEYAGRYSDGKEHFGHVLDHLFSPALKACGYDVIPPTAAGSDLIHAEIIKRLEEADLVLCDISCLNANVFFELGIRTALDRPVAIVKDNQTSYIPFDTGSINTHSYDASLTPWSLKIAIPDLSKHIKLTVERADGRNSLWRYFGLTQRAAPPEIANPTDAMLNLIVSELADIRRLAEAARISPSLWSDRPKVFGHQYAGAELFTMTEAVLVAEHEGFDVGREIAKGAPELWLEAVLARKPRMPSDLEARLLSESKLPVDALTTDEVRQALRRGAWAAFEGKHSGPCGHLIYVAGMGRGVAGSIG